MHGKPRCSMSAAVSRSSRAAIQWSAFFWCSRSLPWKPEGASASGACSYGTGGSKIFSISASILLEALDDAPGLRPSPRICFKLGFSLDHLWSASSTTRMPSANGARITDSAANCGAACLTSSSSLPMAGASPPRPKTWMSNGTLNLFFAPRGTTPSTFMPRLWRWTIGSRKGEISFGSQPTCSLAAFMTILPLKATSSPSTSLPSWWETPTMWVEICANQRSSSSSSTSAFVGRISAAGGCTGAALGVACPGTGSKPAGAPAGRLEQNPSALHAPEALPDRSGEDAEAAVPCARLPTAR
mmetsp:Transcript_33258/g.95661  ORF Transcript_33258/g.95661 Transcript_33258/m.95661 type:complete len:300 (-) Transcript_33258:270-1169(-)